MTQVKTTSRNKTGQGRALIGRCETTRRLASQGFDVAPRCVGSQKIALDALFVWRRLRGFWEGSGWAKGGLIRKNDVTESIRPDGRLLSTHFYKLLII